jgi:hypothetical protein
MDKAKDKAEGERWSSNSDSAANADRNQGGGTSNRPLSEEVENQEELPDRGHARDEKRSEDYDDSRTGRDR